MSLLAGLTGAIGLYNAITGNRRADNLQNQSQQISREQWEYTKESLDSQRALMDALRGLYADRVSGGFYDPRGTQMRINTIVNKNQKEQMGNLASAFRTLGAKDGGSEAERGLAQIGQRTEMERDYMLKQAEQDAANQQMRDLLQIMSAETGNAQTQSTMGAGYANNLLQQANQQRAQTPSAAGVLQSILMSNPDLFGRTNNGPSAPNYSPAVTSAMGGLAGALGGGGTNYDMMWNQGITA